MVVKKDYMVMPSFVIIEHNSSSKTSGRINAGAGDWDGGQMHQKHCKSDWERCQHLQ